MKSSVSRGGSLDYLTVFPDDYLESKSYPLIILLHGFGANKEDLSGLASAINRNGYLYVLPDAPLAMADDATVRAWYERGGRESPEAVRDALHALDSFVAEVLAKYRVHPASALLAGFSQGGAISLRYGLPRPELFAGVAVMSASLRKLDELVATLPAVRNQPIFVAHGRHDSLVPFEWSQNLATFLETQGYQPAYHAYPIDHEISPDLIRDLRRWLSEVLPAVNSPA